MEHRELVLSKKPIAYYPLDADLLNYADTGVYNVANNSIVYDGSTNDATATIFFKGQPLVAGLKNACAFSSTSGFIDFPAHGAFAKNGLGRAISIEFYSLAETSLNASRNASPSTIAQASTSGLWTLLAYKNNYYLRVKPTSDSLIKTVRVNAGKANRPKQIVILWTEDKVSFSVDGVMSDSIDISQMDWTANNTSSIRLSGSGTGTATYKRFSYVNALSVFPYALTSQDIEDLRAAAWQDNEPYKPVAAYGGDFISCNGLNIKRNGQLTISSNDDFKNNYSLQGISTTDDYIGYPDYFLPEYTSTISSNISTQNGFTTLAIGPSKHIDYGSIDQINSADMFGVLIANKGLNYVTKEYVFTLQSQSSFLGIYTNSDAIYYDFTDSITGESSLNNLITSGIGSYNTSQFLFVGISKRSNEIFVGNTNGGQSTTTIYTGATKVAFAQASSFFGQTKMRIGGDLRVSLDTDTEFTGYFRGIVFGFPQDTGLTTGFYVFAPSINSTHANASISYAGQYSGDWMIPTELISLWNGTTTAPGSIVGYLDGDAAGADSFNLYYGNGSGTRTTPTVATATYSATGVSNGVSNIMNLKVPPSSDSTGTYSWVKVKPNIYQAPYVYPTINGIDLVSYKVDANGYVDIKDGRSQFTLEASPYMIVPPGEMNAHSRGPNDGLRNTSGANATTGAQPRIVIPANKTLYGISFMAWIDADPQVPVFTSTTSFPIQDFLTIKNSSSTDVLRLALRSSATTRYFGVDVLTPVGNINSVTGTRIYINGEHYAYSLFASPGTPTVDGKLKINAWNHFFISLETAITGGATILFDKSVTNNSAYFSSFELGVCINDIGVFTDSIMPTAPGNTTIVNSIASVLARPYIKNTDIQVLVSQNETLTGKYGDGVSNQSDKQWKPLIS